MKQRRARRTFSAQEKADAVRMVKAGKSASHVAWELDLTLTSLQAWVKQADADAGVRSDILTTEEREELACVARTRRACSCIGRASSPIAITWQAPMS